MIGTDIPERRSEFFERVDCASWEDLLAQLERLESGWLFRGVRDAQWDLCTSLERHTPSGSRKSEAEDMLLEEFRRRAHLHLPAHHVPSDVLEWLALLQHWGGPTRLLDFTASPYVAAYFAVEDAVERDGRCAVWAVEKRAVWRCSADVLMRATKEHAPGIGLFVGREPRLFEKFVLTNEHTCVIEVVPGRFSERLSMQQGVFLCPANVDQTFMENLAATALPQESIKKLTLPVRYQGRALERLRAMNITRATLFPGLEGLAQSFRQLLIGEPADEKRARQRTRAVLEGLKNA